MGTNAKRKRVPYKGTDPVLMVVGDIGAWVRYWPSPPTPGCQVFAGHSKRLAEVRALLEAAGFTVRETKPNGHVLEQVGEDEIELVRLSKAQLRGAIAADTGKKPLRKRG